MRRNPNQNITNLILKESLNQKLKNQTGDLKLDLENHGSKTQIKPLGFLKDYLAQLRSYGDPHIIFIGLEDF